jgi:hypothetical protein
VGLSSSPPPSLLLFPSPPPLSSPQQLANGVGIVHSYYICYKLWHQRVEEDERDEAAEKAAAARAVLDRVVRTCEEEGAREGAGFFPTGLLSAATAAECTSCEVSQEEGDRGAMLQEDGGDSEAAAVAAAAWG